MGRMMDHVIGIDPGETTGICAIRLGSGSGPLKERIRKGVVMAGQMPVEELLKEHDAWRAEALMQGHIVSALHRLAVSWRVEDCLNLAIEDFIIRERTTDRSLLSPVRMTSGILALVVSPLSGLTRTNVVFNSASDAMSTVTDKTLKSYGLHKPGRTHQNDAARHAVLALRKDLK